MANNWHEIWNKRQANFQNVNMDDEQQVIVELKRAAGFDFFGKSSGLAFEEFKKAYQHIRANLGFINGTGSVFEVGCGSGANLYLFLKDGFKIGGADYSESLLEVAKKIIGEENFIECFCGDAAEISTEIKYDAVFSSEVFPYLHSLEHVEKVLNLMLKKTNHSLSVNSVYDESKKEDYLKFRRETTPDYDERYKNLPKLFMTKEFFIQYAEKNNLELKFDRYHMKGYWNEPFVFDCFMYKK